MSWPLLASYRRLLASRLDWFATLSRSAARRIRPLQERTPAESQALWESMLPLIRDDLIHLHSVRARFELLVDASKGSSIPQPNHILDFVAGLYASEMLLGIRRQTDRDRRTASMRRLMADLATYPQHASRDWYVTKYSSSMQEIAHRTFDGFSRRDGDAYVDPKRIHSDLASLSDVTAAITRFANSRVAHLSATGPAPAVTFSELQIAVETFEHLLRRYYLLVDGRGLSEATPTMQFDFLHPLSVPWVDRS